MLDQSTVPPIHFLQRQAASLLLYQSVFEDAIGQAFLDLITALRQSYTDTTTQLGFNHNGMAALQAYGRWFHTLAHAEISWQEYLIIQILSADNPFTQQAQRKPLAELSPALCNAVRHDLQALQNLYNHDDRLVSRWVQEVAALPTPPITWEHHPDQPHPHWKTLHQSPIWKKLIQAGTWADLVDDLALHYRQFGSGVVATYVAFRWHGGELVGVAHPDPIRLDELVGYEMQKAALLKNTIALLSGYRALHVLLYGSRGSGKSSLVKALVQDYHPQGLRLVEVSKADLKDLPAIVDRLRDLPQKFIIFVDDLSFEEDDDAYKALKVVLEGNITARPQNIVVYATSNRRHLIREFFGDRPRPSDADEIHAWDTVQEKLSFSDRFGLTLTFEPANQTTYLEIVHHLARQANIILDANELDFRALQWATQHNGRSGRTARQFIDFLRAELSVES